MAIVNAFPGAKLHPSPYFGYPLVGSGRRIKPTILQVVHTTETTGVPYPSGSKSWTFVVERNGTVHQFLDPMTQAPWTNGDAQSRDMSSPHLAGMNLSKYNANEYCLLTVENVNAIRNGQRLTTAQLQANHDIAVWASKLSGIPVDRNRIVGHYQFNGVSRVNCPTVPSDRARVFNGVISGTTLADTGLPKEDSMPNITRFAIGTATLDANSQIRTAPRLAESAKWFLTANEAKVGTAVGYVEGDEHDGSTEWLAYFVIAPRRWAYTHSSNVKNFEAPTGSTADKEALAAYHRRMVEIKDTVAQAASKVAGI